MMKIAHIADLHIKIRDSKIGYLNIENHLNDIVSTIENENIDVVVIAGDLFDITPQNELEQKIVYDFLTKILSIDYLKEMVLINGNHDILHKKQIHSYIDEFSALQTYVNLLRNTNKHLFDKLIYGIESRIYQSIYYRNIEYNIYSWEDSVKNNSEPKDANKFRIGIYHDILVDYVLEKSLPIRKDILERKLSIHRFKDDLNDVVLAGDIHDNWTDFDNYFFYSGSTNQVNFGEGIYIKILENQQSSINLGVSKKFINIYTFKNQQFKQEKPYELTLFDNHFTIEIPNTRIGMNYIISEIDRLLPDGFIDSCKHWVKLKLPITYKVNEQDLISKVKDVFSRHYKLFDVEISYTNKSMVDDSLTSNLTDTIKQVVDEIKEFQPNVGIDEKDYDTFADFDIHSNVQTLSDEQLMKIFDIQLSKFDDVINKEFGESVEVFNIHDEITSIFKQEYDTIQNQSKTQKFDIRLKSVYCNQFMGLCENTINLKIPGIVRILGSNGVGKTTLFTLIRYIIDSQGFDGLKQNQKIRNTLLFFNDSQYSVDEQKLRLEFDINNSSVTLYRNYERIWKNNISDEQKQSKEWRDFVSTVKTSAKMVIFNNTSQKETIIENIDDINNMLNLWFKNVLDTITFINYGKIRDLITKEPKELKDIILHYIGLEYIDKLKNNLGNVKDSMNIVRPKESIQTLQDQRTLLLEHKDYDSEIDELKISLQTATDKHTYFIVDKTNKQNELHGLKELMIEFKGIKNNIKSLESDIESYGLESYEKKVVVDNSQEFIDKQNELTEEYRKNLLTYNDTIQTFTNKINEFHTEYENIFSRYKTLYNDKFLDLQKDFNDKNNTLILKRQEIINEYILKIQTVIDKMKFDVKNLQDENVKLRNQIDSGKCPECGRPFEDDIEHFESMKQQNNQKIIENNDNIKLFTEKIQVYGDKLQELKKPDYTNSNLESIDNEIQSLKQTYTQDKLVIESIIHNINNCIIDDKYMSREDVDTCMYISENLENYNNLIKTEKEKHQQFIKTNKQSLSEVQLAFEKHKRELKEMIDYNSVIDEMMNKVSELNRFKDLSLQEKYQNLSVDVYNKYNEELLEIENTINKLSVEITSLNDKITALNVEKSVNKQKLIEVQEKISDYYDYRRKEVIYKIYKDIIEKHLPSAVFMWYQQYINKTLEYLLKDNNFSMYWDIDGNLQMISYNQEGSVIYRPISLVSGMESTFLGLSLIFTLHNLNIKNQLSHIFIDELSGALSTGDNLKTFKNQLNKNIDFQEKFVNLLNRFTNKSIFIVDHNIDNLFETYEYNVVRTGNGGKFISI